MKSEQIFIIGNPNHDLGFMVVYDDEPLGFKSPLKALSRLEEMRKAHGSHIKLYKVDKVNMPVICKKDLRQHNKQIKIEDFDYSLVGEYIE